MEEATLWATERTGREVKSMDDLVSLAIGELRPEPLLSHSTLLSSRNRMIVYLCSMMCLECEMSNTAINTLSTFGMLGILNGVLIILVNVASMHCISYFIHCDWMGMLVGMVCWKAFYDTSCIWICAQTCLAM